MTDLNEQIKLLNETGKADGVIVEVDGNGQLIAKVGDKVAKSVQIRIIEDVEAPLTIRLIKDKQGGIDVVYSNIPSASDVLARGGVCAEFVEKYFSSSYVRKLISLPAITKLAELLAPNNGGGSVANPITKPFNALCKALAISLKKQFPTKAGIISAAAVKTYLIDGNTANITLGKCHIKGKDVSAADFIMALMKWHCTSENPNAVNFANAVSFAPADYVQYAIDSAAKIATKEVEQSIDESELDI